MSLTDTVDITELQKKIAELINENKSLKKQKKFGLVWEDKPDAQVLRVLNEAPMLREEPSKAVVGDTNAINHILINGDNFHALTALRATHMGKVDVIYIDPPYNTGNKDFIYNDNFLDKEDGYRHSKWLSFMEKRLTLAKEFLSEAGVIFVSIDDNEQARLKLLMDEIFGPQNFIANVIWDGGQKNNAKFVSNGHDYLVFYSKNIELMASYRGNWKEPKKGVHEALTFLKELNVSENNINEATSTWKTWLKNSLKEDLIGDNIYRYSHLTVNGRASRIDGNISAPKAGAIYDVFHPKTNLPVKKPLTGWRYTEETMKELISNGTVSFGIDENQGLILRSFLDELSDAVPTSVFQRDRNGASISLSKIIGRGSFDFPKNVDVIKRWISIVANKDAIVLDFFAGSGTTAHAVAELNKEDGGTRQCILVTDGGKTEITGESAKNATEGSVNIAEEITYERVRRVLTGKDWSDGKGHEPLGGNLRYFKVAMEQSPHGATERDQRLTLEKYTIEHAKISENVFDVVASKDDFDDETLTAIDYKVFSSGTDNRYLVGVNNHDYVLSELETWFAGLPVEAKVIMVGSGLEEIGWVKNNSDRIRVDDILGRTIRSRKYVASKLPLG